MFKCINNRLRLASVKLNGARNSWGSETLSSETFLITDMSNEVAPVVMGKTKAHLWYDGLITMFLVSQIDVNNYRY